MVRRQKGFVLMIKNKRVIACITASAVICGAAGNTVFSAGTDAYRHLVEALYGVTAPEKADDVNEDGKISILDLIMMKNSIITEEDSTGTVENDTFRAAAENVKLTGRTYDDGSVTWLVQSGSAVEFDLTASEASVVLAGDSSIKAEEKYRPRYAVLVDDRLVEDALMSTESKEVVLLKENAQKTVRVKIIHLSEANNGAVGVESIKTVSSARNPVKPVAKKDLCIEFVGDSITCAYGVEGKSSGEPFMTSTENFMKSYAYLTAQKLGADYSAVSYSGHGIVSGYSSSGEKEAGSLVPDCYENIAKLAPYSKPWDFEKQHNDVVVINLGTNDDTYVRTDPDTRLDEYAEEYFEFLKMVRKNNPDAYIICTVGTMGCEEMYPGIEKAVSEFKSNSDSNIMCYLSAVQNASNGYGSDWHPSEITQQLSAYVLADKICTALGIESDKVGLDAAADAEYEAVINKDAGANASTYLGYDKSFWVNMVGGGSEKSDVQAVVSGFDLTPGRYTLKFDITAGKDVSIPVSVQDGAGKKIYDDEISAGASKLAYGESFTVADGVSGARIVLDVGGTDYYNITLANLSLIKTDVLK